MFNIKSKQDHLNYGNALIPENLENPILEFAIGTTYSLDFQMLMATTIALENNRYSEDDLKNETQLLTVLANMKSKMVVFTDAAHMKNLKDKNPLYRYFENIVVPVRLNCDNKGYPAFHPKMWLLKFSGFQNETPTKIYRLVILSRNLTFDKNLDIAISFEGNFKNKLVKKSEPICSFVKYLKTSVTLDKEQEKILNRIIKEIPFVNFKLGKLDNKEIFDDFEFLPIGIGKNAVDIKNENLFEKRHDEILIMSPFVSKNIINNLFRDKDVDGNLITRCTELEKIKDCHCLANTWVTKDFQIQNNDEELPELYDIHAKIYYTRTNSDICIYLGSMNATESAVSRNVELLLKLYSTKSKIPNFKNEIFGIEQYGINNSLFKKVDWELLDESLDEFSMKLDSLNNLEKCLQDFLRIEKDAYVEKSENEKFSVIIKMDLSCFEEKYEIKISPSSRNDYQKLEGNVFFSNLKKSEITEFFSIKITSVAETFDSIERLVHIAVRNIPSDKNQAIIQEIISDEKSFYEWLSYILKGNFVPKELFNQNHKDSSINNKCSNFIQSNKNEKKSCIFKYPIYEQLLKTLSANPQKIQDISNIINALDNETIVSKEFREMFQIVENCLSKRK